MPSPGTELIKRRPYQIAGLIAGLAFFAYGLVAAVFG